MEKAIIYTRVSSKEQEETGYSLDAQEQFLKEYAQKLGLPVAKIYKVTESASKWQLRKTLDAMLEYAVEHDVKVILGEKIDRLTRSLKDAAIIDDWVHDEDGRQVHFVKEHFIVSKETRAHDNFVWDMKVAVARFYTNNLSEEVKKGQKQKIAEGWLPTKPPLGYKTVGEKGKKIHMIDDDKAPFVRRMFEMYSSGNYSVISLADAMYRDGLRNRANKKVGKSRMYDMLRDPFYYGAMQWKGQVFAAKHEPLISKELFDRVQALLARPFNQLQMQKHLPVFKAKMRCGACGGSVTWETHKGYWYGHCNGYKRKDMKAKCESRHIFLRQDRIEELMFPLFEKATPKGAHVIEVLKEALKESHAEEVDRFDAQLTSLNLTIDRSQRRLETIYEDKLDGKISAEMYESLAKRYSSEKEAATGEISRLNRGNKRYYEAGYAIHELALQAAAIYSDEKTTNEDRRMLLSYVFSNIELNGEEPKFFYTPAFDFVVNWVPKLNLILELENSLETKRRNGAFAPSHPVLLRG